MPENILLTPKILKYVSIAFTYGGKFQAHMFTWNPATQLPELVTSKRRKALWKLNFISSMIYYIFVFVRFYQICLTGHATDEDKIYMYFILVFYSFIPLLHANYTINRVEWPLCFARSLKYLRSIETQFIKADAKTPKQIKTIEKLVELIYIALNFNMILVVIVSIVRPESPEFFTSVILPIILEESIGLRILIRVLNSVFQAWLMYIYYSQCFVGVLAVLPVLTLLLAFTDELSEKTCRLTNAEFRQPMNKVMAWKTLGLLVSDVNEACDTGIAGAKVLLIFYAVFCTYGALKFEGVLALGLGVIGADATTFLVLLFTLLYGIHEKTTDTLTNWKSEMAAVEHASVGPKGRSELSHGRSGASISKAQEALLFKKYFRSFKPIAYILKGMYRVDKEMVLTMYEFIVESTVNFSLMYR